MAIALLAVYIGLIFIRPMEWVEGLKGYPLINNTAIATLFFSFPTVMEEFAYIWNRIPQVKIAIVLLFAVTLSFAAQFNLTATIETFQNFSTVVVLYVLTILLARTRKSLLIIYWTVLVCVSWMAVHGILQIHQGVGFGGQTPMYRKEWDLYQIRAFGIFNDPNDLCMVFVFAVPMLVAGFKAAPNALLKLAVLVMLPLNLYAAWLTNSRGGVMGLFGMLGAYAIARAKGMHRWILAGIGILLIGGVAPSRYAQGMGVDTGRLACWGEGIVHWQSGIRLMIFGNGYLTYPDITDEGQNAHNAYCQILVECGLVGYIPWFVLIYLTMTYARRTINIVGLASEQDRVYLSGIFSASVGYLTCAYFLSRAYNHVLFVLMALAVCQVVISLQDRHQMPLVFGELKKDLRRAVLWGFASVFLIWLSIRVGYAVSGGG